MNTLLKKFHVTLEVQPGYSEIIGGPWCQVVEAIDLSEAKWISRFLAGAKPIKRISVEPFQ